MDGQSLAIHFVLVVINWILVRWCPSFWETTMIQTKGIENGEAVLTMFNLLKRPFCLVSSFPLLQGLRNLSSHNHTLTPFFWASVSPVHSSVVGHPKIIKGMQLPGLGTLIRTSRVGYKIHHWTNPTWPTILGSLFSKKTKSLLYFKATQIWKFQSSTLANNINCFPSATYLSRHLPLATILLQVRCRGEHQNSSTW